MKVFKILNCKNLNCKMEVGFQSAKTNTDAIIEFCKRFPVYKKDKMFLIAVYFIDESVFMLDFEKLKCGSDKLIPSLLKKFEDNGAAIAKPKGMTADGKYLAVEAKGKENFFLKADFKYFDDEAEFYYKYHENNVDSNILFVCECGEIVGILCAVRNVK